MKDDRKKQTPNQSLRRRPKPQNESFRDVRRASSKNLLEERRKASAPKKEGTPSGLIWIVLGVGGIAVVGLIIWLVSDHYSGSTEDFVVTPRVTKVQPSTPSPTPALPADGEGATQGPATPSGGGERKTSPASPDAPGTAPPGSLEVLTQKLKPAIVFISADLGGGMGSEGTGFFISSQGFLLTCEHVIESARRLRVRTADEQEIDATVVWQDKARDLALVKIPRGGMPVIPLAETQVREGHPIIVVGFPLGSSLGREPTVTTGILSALRRRNGLEALQISAPINPGNSGGPLVSAQTGKVVGVVSTKVTNFSDVEGRNEDSVRTEGIGFAVPITQELREILEGLMR